MKQEKWTPTETQRDVLKALADGKIKSLTQISAELGKTIHRGLTSVLSVKGMIEVIPDGVECLVEIVETRTYADGSQIVIKKLTAETTETGYRLLQK